MLAPPAMDAHLVVELESLERSYFALSPALSRDVSFPSNAQLALPVVQNWLAQRLADERFLTGTWRKGFWKELVLRIEDGVAASDPAQELVLDDALADLSAVCVSQSASDTVLRKYMWAQNESVTCLEQAASISQGTTGLRTWQASIRLANHLIAQPELVRGKRVFELGAGAGLLSLVCARLSASNVYVTDLSDDVCDRLRHNAELNGMDSGVLDIEQLDWFEPAALAVLGRARPDLILGADIVYDATLAEGLAQYLDRGLRDHREAQVLLAATIRDATTWSAFQQSCERHRLDLLEQLQLSLPAGQEVLGGFDEQKVTGAEVVIVRITRNESSRS